MRNRRRRSLAKPVMTVAVLAAAALTVFWYYRPQERPAWVTEALPIAPEAEVALYRWRDANGQTVVSDEPPPEGVVFERVEYRNDANVLPAPKD